MLDITDPTHLFAAIPVPTRYAKSLGMGFWLAVTLGLCCGTVLRAKVRRVVFAGVVGLLVIFALDDFSERKLVFFPAGDDCLLAPKNGLVTIDPIALPGETRSYNPTTSAIDGVTCETFLADVNRHAYKGTILAAAVFFLLYLIPVFLSLFIFVQVTKMVGRKLPLEKNSDNSE